MCCDVVQAVLNTVVYQMLIVYANVLVNSAVLFKQQKTFSVFAQPDVNKREVGGIRYTVMQPRDEVGGLHNGREISQSLECLCQDMHTKKKTFSVAFMK